MKRYEMFSTINVKPPIIMATGFADDTSVTRFGPSYRNLYIVHYVLSGSGVFNGNKVGAGEGFLIRPNTFEEYYPDLSNSPGHWLCLMPYEYHKYSRYRLYP